MLHSATYNNAMQPALVGLTGDPKAMVRVARLCRARFRARKVDSAAEAGQAALTVLVALTMLMVLVTGSPARADGNARLESYAVDAHKIGGDFTLINQDGVKTRLSQFRGKRVLLSFGYTYCPDVCPLTLLELVKVKQQLGTLAGRVWVLFVSVDPQRDTPAQLKRYLHAFDPAIMGLTGDLKAIMRVTRLYRARFRTRKVDSAAGYLVDHTAFTYLIDAQGKTRYVFPFKVGAEIIAEGVRELLRKGS